MKRTVSFALALLGLALPTIIAGCGGGAPAITGAPITVSVSADNPTVQASGVVSITATVNSDPSSKGVTWAVSCGVSQCGSVSPTSTPSGVATTYTAPSTPPSSDLTVTIKATSVADTSKSNAANVTVDAIRVSVSPTTATVQAGGMVPINASADNDPSGQGVAWTISPASGAGSLISMTNSSVTYNAPATPPASDLTVTITATSVIDTSKSASVIITVPTVVVSITPANPLPVEAGSTQPFTATVNPDPASKGVTWTISPASGAGTLINVTGTSVTYKAPATPPADDLIVTITATSVSDPLGSSSATFTVPAIAVSITQDTATVQAGGTASITATVNNDSSNKGVTWALSCDASQCGSVSPTSTPSGIPTTYTAPPTPPPSDVPVTITATAVADTSKTNSATVTVLAITVSVGPSSALIPVDATPQLDATPFTATVSNDPGNKGASWTLTQGTTGPTTCSPMCGTIAPTSTASGTPTIYSAPATVPADTTVTLTATSVGDATKTASATITLTVGTVKLIPAKLDFGRLNLKFIKSAALKTTLTNTGSTALSITGETITGANSDKFHVTNDGCDGSVPSGTSCDIQVTFTPQATGSFTASLSISDSSAGSPQQVALSGKACSGLGCRNPAVLQSALAMNRTAAVPGPTGPSKVGTRIMDLVDATRSDPYLANGTKRELLVRFWYPASLNQSCKPAAYTTPTVWRYFSQLVGIPLPQVRTNSCLDAPITEGVHPVVVFTHGYTGTFSDYTFLFEDLASRGYVVASVAHTYEATAVEFPDKGLVKSVLGSHLGKTLRSDAQAISFAVSVRLGDLKFVVDELEGLNADAKSPFVGKLDMSSVALAGHSLGGLTALLGVEQEPRFRAGIFIDGVVPDSLFIPTEKPVLILTAGREQWGENECRLWGELRGPRLAVNLKGADHLTPSDAVWLAKGAIKTGTMGPEKTVAAIRDYIAAFLDTNLRRRPSDPLLTTPSADFPDANVTTQTQSPCGETIDHLPR